jgi:hypothetical protein
MRVRECGLASSCLGYEPLMGFCEQVRDGDFLDWLNNYQLLRKVYAISGKFLELYDMRNR